jgi:hypothetical protein
MKPLKPELATPAKAAALRFSLPYSLVRAVVFVESSDRTSATRHEPHYRWLWNVEKGQPYRIDSGEIAGYAKHRNKFPKDFPGGLTEFDCQRTSYGLMQIMGAVARELGFIGAFSGLLKPEVNLHYGCSHLASYVRKFGMHGGVSAYNSGSPTSNAGLHYAKKISRAGGFGG